MQRFPDDQFPHGFRVLLVGSDHTTITGTENLCLLCNYLVTKSFEATAALNLLRGNKGNFDLILSDEHMSDMDVYEFIEHVVLETNLPLIMMSSDGRTSSVMKGLRSGACHYLIKPVSEEVLRNVWQHVWKRKLTEKKEYEHSGCVEDNNNMNNDQNKQGKHDDHAEAEYPNSLLDLTREEATFRALSKRSSSLKEDDDGESVNNDDPPTKKRRVVWSAELHDLFVSAVDQLGIEKAVPKGILELMNVPGLTRENVASHLQKYRIFLKRRAEFQHQQNNMMMPINTVSGAAESKLGTLETETSDLVSSQPLAVLPPEVLVRRHPNHYNNSHPEHSKNSPKHSIVTMEEIASSGSHNSNTIATTVGPNAGMVNVVENKNTLLNILHHQIHQQNQQQQESLVMHQDNCSFRGNNNALTDHSSTLFSHQPNNSSLNNIAQFSGGYNGAPSGTISPPSTSTSPSYHQLQSSALGLPYGYNCDQDALDQVGPVGNHGFVIPSGFSALETESCMNDLSQGNIAFVDSNGNIVDEPNMDFINDPVGDIPAFFQRYPSLDYMFME